jgi:hypothetical protein
MSQSRLQVDIACRYYSYSFSRWICENTKFLDPIPRFKSIYSLHSSSMHVTFTLGPSPPTQTDQVFPPSSQTPFCPSTTSSATDVENSQSPPIYPLHEQHPSTSRLPNSIMPRRKAPTCKSRQNPPPISFTCVYIFFVMVLSLLAASLAVLLTLPISLPKVAWSAPVVLAVAYYVSTVYLRSLKKCMQNNEWQIKQDKKDMKALEGCNKASRTGRKHLSRMSDI